MISVAEIGVHGLHHHRYYYHHYYQLAVPAFYLKRLFGIFPELLI